MRWWTYFTVLLHLTSNSCLFAQLGGHGHGREGIPENVKSPVVNKDVAEKPEDSNMAVPKKIEIELLEHQAKDSETNKELDKKPTEVNPDQKVLDTNANKVVKNEAVDKVKDNDKTPISDKKGIPEVATVTTVKKHSQDLIQSGALLRGFYVFLGLSIVVVFYFAFRSYRLRRGGQVSTTVRKYGVVARRSDLEMRRLELDDDDDDTLFEINQNVNR